MQLLKHVDVEQEFVEEENKSTVNCLSSSFEHIQQVDEKTSEDLTDIAME
jgi:hypothetical protein